MQSIANIISFIPEIAAALPLTLLLTVIAGFFGLLIGTFVALGRLSDWKLISWPCQGFGFAFRGTPLLVQLYLIYYGLGEILPGTWVRYSPLWPYLRDALWYAILVLTLNQAAYNAEVIRGAIWSVSKGQIEAARAIGMGRGRILRRITLPQAFRQCLPVLTSDLIILLKSTSLASTITVMEVLGTARKMQRETLLVFEPLIAAGIIYFVVVFTLTRVMGVAERRMTRYRMR